MTSLEIVKKLNLSKTHQTVANIIFAKKIIQFNEVNLLVRYVTSAFTFSYTSIPWLRRQYNLIWVIIYLSFLVVCLDVHVKPGLIKIKFVSYFTSALSWHN